LLDHDQLGVHDDPFLKTEEFRAGGIGIRGRGNFQQPAEVVEMFLIRRRFLAGIGVPLLLE
jgi:hypothetical protein